MEEPRPHAQHNLMQRSDWETGEATPPRPQKRKKTKKDKKGKKAISAPLKVRHVGTSEVLEQLENQSKFPVEHVAVMSVGQQLESISPYDSIQHSRIKTLLQQGDTLTKDVLLCVTNTALRVKDIATKVSVLEIPLHSIVKCQSVGDAGSSFLIITVDNTEASSKSHVHFFHSTRTPMEVICKEINIAKQNDALSKCDNIERQTKIDKRGKQNSEALLNNWILQAPSIPACTSPSLPTPHLSSSPSLPKLPPFLQGSPPPPPTSQPPPSSKCDSLYGNQLTCSPVGLSVPQTLSSNDDMRSKSSPQSPNVRDMVRSTSNKLISNSHPRSQGEGGESSEIRRTMKASRIQRDVDILNHVIEDLDEFIRLLKMKAAAWTELEKKKKKSKRRKHDSALEALRAKAEPPTEDEFKEAYKKCKFALNLIAKLGHHLSAPSASELQAGIFLNYISELVSINKGPQLASAVVSPLLTQQAIDLMERTLPQSATNTWRQLGANWFLTMERWPQNAPPPPEYQIKFSDGCIPPNLHNASDCPANFPTLDTLPREKRESSLEYSDAYDMANQPEAESGLLINPAVKAAVESQFAAVPMIPEFVQRKGSLVPQGNQGDLPRHFARAQFDYNATTPKELSVHRGERVEILDDSRKWWKVKNYQGHVGYLPGNQLEPIMPKKKNEVVDGANMIDVHGRKIPAPPRLTPPPIPSPGSRRPSISTAKYSPQPGHHGGKASHQSHLSPLFEESEPLQSTIRYPQHPPLAPPPSFSPALPNQSRTTAPVPPPPAPTTGNGMPPPPPPPPPVIPQKPPMSLQEIIAQHKVKSKQEKTQKTSVVQKGKEDSQFDITAALKTRKPLRKTTKACLIGDGKGSENSGMNLQQQLQRKFEIGTNVKDLDYQVLSWRANKQAIKDWLVNQGYGNCADKLTEEVNGSQLYCMDREALRGMFGPLDGVRLYSQLQKDKPKSEKEAGVVKESAFEKIMRIRKNTLDVRNGDESTIPELKEPPQHFHDRETVLDEAATHSLRGRGSKGKAYVSTEHGNHTRYHDGDHTARHRDQNDYESQSIYKGRKLSDDSIFRGHRQKRGHSHRSDRYSGTYSDDEDARKMNRSRRLHESNRYFDSQSSSESHRNKKCNGRRKERRQHRESKGRRKPTNIDDFDEGDWSKSDRDSSSYSSDYSLSESDSEQGRPQRLRSSASASVIRNAAWALQGQSQEGELTDSRIKAQEAEIKKLLSNLGELQKTSGVKHLPVERQKELQKGLRNLEYLQICRKEKPGNASVLAQLIGEQMLLCDHLRDAIYHVKVKGFSLSMSPGNRQQQQLQALAQQQAQAQQHALAQQQQQLLLEAEQQKQLLLAAAEQQRQLQLSQMVSQQQQLLEVQSPGYGMQGLGGIYSPSYAGVTYF